MDIDILKEQVEKGLSSYKIAEELGLSGTTVRYWLRKHKLSTNAKVSTNRKCVKCDSSLMQQQVKYCSTNCKSSDHSKNRKAKNPNTSWSQHNRGSERKAMLVMEAGGGCSVCGYNKNLGALQFHHTGEKNFVLDMRTMGNLSLDRIRVEAKNCVVLCGNCHAEEHYPHLEKWQERELNKATYHLNTKLERIELNKVYCTCGSEIVYGSKQCKPCSTLAKRKVDRPSVEQITLELASSSYKAVGRKYGVSDNTIRKWLK